MPRTDILFSLLSDTQAQRTRWLKWRKETAESENRQKKLKCWLYNGVRGNE